MVTIDIFDRIMLLPGLRLLNPFYRKHKEILLYFLFGGLAMIVSIFSFWLCDVPFGLNALTANLISWIAAVSFAYITNSIWVFRQTASTIGELISQLRNFFSGRVATLLVEEVILWAFVDRLHFNSLLIKIAAQVVVIILNYLISKFFVFQKHNKEGIPD